MGKLDGAIGYLSGAMESVVDHGVGWRREFVYLCDKAGLQIDYLDPTNKPGNDLKVGEDKPVQVRLQKEGRWAELKEYVSDYRHIDLRFVDLSDFLVIVVTPEIHMCGTYDEVFTAEHQKKPLFFVCEGGLGRLPRWLFDVIDLDDEARRKRCNVFTSLEEVVAELVKIDSGEIPMSKDWVLIRQYLKAFRYDNA